MPARRRRALGSPAADPREIIAVASAEVPAANTALKRRQAAEKASLALMSAVENAAGVEIHGSRGLRLALAQIRQCPGFEHVARAVNELRRDLHSGCFYQARCAFDLQLRVGRAIQVVEDILAAGRRIRRGDCPPG
jgi:hypothetical protein